MSFTQLSTSNPVARKDYTCTWCGQKIPKGETHHHYTGVFDGEMQSNRLHTECRAAMDKYDKEYPGELGDGFTFGSFGRGCCCDGTCGECSKAQEASHD